ncbi:MAG: DNA internalization-related competence protein ComEC/Rec2 [Chloroflexi bacterium]|nr:DNA internalization-related competence protein ComEC/Rec2 [Chloroflexota bacterium]
MTLVILAVAWFSGVYLGLQPGLSLVALALFALSALLLTWLLRANKSLVFPALLLLSFALGVARGQLITDSKDVPDLRSYHGQGVLEVKGLIVSDPERRGSATRFVFQASSLRTGDDWAPTSAEVMVTAMESSALVRQRSDLYFRYGDEFLLIGSLEEPPTFPEFDYRDYLARQGIDTVMSFPQVILLAEGKGSYFYTRLYQVRQALAHSLNRSVPEPQASVQQALLLGLRKGLPKELNQAFILTGTSHILAISGLHVGILLGMVLVFSEGLLGRRRQLYILLPFVFVWLYALVTGMSLSVTRAAIMASVYLVGRTLGRPGSVLPSLALAAAIMVGLEPQVILDVSFQLSFAAVAGIALLGPPIRSWLTLPGEPKDQAGEGLYKGVALLAETISITIAATVATLPIIAFQFHRISLVGVPATLVSLPLVPAALLTGAITALAGLFHPIIAQPLGWLAWLSTAYMTQVVQLFSLLPHASIELGNVAPVLVWGYYGLLALILLRAPLKRVPDYLTQRLAALIGRGVTSQRAVPWWLLAPAVAAAFLAWFAVFSLPDGQLRVTFLDVGQGDAIFVVTPVGQQILVDGGPDPLGAVRALGERMPFWDRSLDMVVLTHPHEDHVNGLVEVIRRYKVGQIIERQTLYDTPSYQAWHELIQLKGIPVLQAEAYQLVALDGGVYLQVLSPGPHLLEGTSSDVNNGSVVVRLVYGEVSFLLTGDIQSEVEGMLVSQNMPLRSTVLKVAHHGSRGSSSPGFLKAVNPSIAVISLGTDNRFGHPHAEALEALHQILPEEMIFYTNKEGTVQLITDGKRLKVAAQVRKAHP